jgi:hypothetical protein
MTQQQDEIGRETKLAERRALRKQITTLLRRFYVMIVRRGVPERFASMVNEMELREPHKPGDRKSESVS